MCEVCRTTVTGAVGASAARRAQEQHDRKIRQETIRMMTGGRPAAPSPTVTEKAQTGLVVVGCIVLLASVNLIVHVLVVALATVLGVLLLAAGGLAIRRRRRHRVTALIPAPLPTALPRIVVTAVTVRPLDAPRPRGSLPRRAAERERA